jgi:predicted transcriptional regulator of viral defense system
MSYLQLQQAVKTPVFTILDVGKCFPKECDHALRVQLFRFRQRGLIKQIKRGLYFFPSTPLDELQVAGLLYQPSYISLETALNYHGVIPDITAGGITCVTPTTTKKFSTDFGRYFYHKIPPRLFWGFTTSPPRIAFPEKALLDYAYLYGPKATRSLRLDGSKINRRRYQEFKKEFGHD